MIAFSLPDGGQIYNGWLKTYTYVRWTLRDLAVGVRVEFPETEPGAPDPIVIVGFSLFNITGELWLGSGRARLTPRWAKEKIFYLGQRWRISFGCTPFTHWGALLKRASLFGFTFYELRIGPFSVFLENQQRAGDYWGR